VTNTASWPIKTLLLSRLLPDPDNVRIQGVVTDERSTLKYLYDNEEVLDLAKDILRDGYTDIEPLLVYLEGSKYVVLEGNRRVSALKGLKDPNQVAGWTARIQAEKERIDGYVEVTRVRVIVAPDRQAGLPAVARLHTRTSKKRWAREQQAKFFFDKVSGSVTVANLRAEYPAEASKIPKFISMGDMAARARAAAASNKIALAFMNTTGFKMTSFEYLYNSSVFRNLSGVTFSPEGFATFSATSDEETKRLLVQIILDLKSGLLSTRTANRKVGSKEHSLYVESLMRIARGTATVHTKLEPEDEDEETTGGDGGDVRDGGGSDGGASAGTDGNTSGTGDVPIDGEEDDDDEDEDEDNGEENDDEGASGFQGKRERSPNAAAFDRRLDFNGLPLRLPSPGLRARYDELRRLEVNTFPNAAVDTIRTFLEVSLKVYFLEAGTPVTSPKGPVQLSHCLLQAATHFKSNQAATHVLGVLKSNQTLTSGKYLGSAMALNNSNHEPEAIFSREDVNAMWAQLKPLIKILLSGPVAPAADDAAQVVGDDK
jgi:hypothetical protein